MNIKHMTRKDFIDLPKLDYFNQIKADSAVLIPSRRKHDDSEFGLYEVVLCDGDQPLGKIDLYDIFSIWTSAKSERVGVDLLFKSGLFRIFLQQDNYFANPCFHELRSDWYDWLKGDKK